MLKKTQRKAENYKSEQNPQSTCLCTGHLALVNFIKALKLN